MSAAALIKVPAFIVYSENALATALTRRFIAKLAGPHEELWLTSRGQIDFDDQPALIDAAADAIDFFTRNSYYRICDRIRQKAEGDLR